MIADYELCPNCGERRLPPVGADSLATARSCQNCGLIVEVENSRPTPDVGNIFRCPSCGKPISESQWNAFEGTCAGCAAAIAKLPF